MRTEAPVVRVAGAADAHPAASRLPGAAAVWIDVLGGQAAWWTCVLLARTGRESLALAGPALYLAAHVAAGGRRRRGVLVLAAVAAAAGFAGDTLLVRAGFLEVSGDAGASRPWMASLWAAFAVSMTVSLRWLVGRPPALVAVLGAAAGPLAYAAGERLGALSLSTWAPAAVAVEWAVATPLLVVCARRLAAPPVSAAETR